MVLIDCHIKVVGCFGGYHRFLHYIIIYELDMVALQSRNEKLRTISLRTTVSLSFAVTTVRGGMPQALLSRLFAS